MKKRLRRGIAILMMALITRLPMNTSAALSARQLPEYWKTDKIREWEERKSLKDVSGC
jgi:hypothetical protein